VSARTATRLAWALWALILVIQAAGLVFYGLAGNSSSANLVSAGIVAFFVFQLFATVGAVIAARRPENPIGWLFLAVPLLTGLANTSGGYIELATERGLGGAVAVAVAFGWTWLAALGVAAVIILLFPDGRLPSPRWRPIEVFAAVWIIGVAVSYTLKAGPLDDPLEHVDNPIGIPGFGFVVDVLGLIGLAVLLIAAVTSLALRFVRNPEQRQQIKWVLASVGVALLVIVPLNIADAFSTSFDGPPDAIFLLALGTIPLATGLAILKYRLYEIDRIVNRAVVYAAVTALLVGVYFGIVLGLQEVFSSFGGGSDLAVAVSTLAVAALFRPLRARVQRGVDRRFYRRRYDAQLTLESFSARLRDEIDIQALQAELTAVVRRTLEPSQVSLWLRNQGAAR
jgi:hypothetical protein